MCPGTTCPEAPCLEAPCPEAPCPEAACPAADPLESDGEAETEAVGEVEAGEAESERYVM
jgi:hypothetical protein